MPQIETECPACDGTGLYVGFAEAKGTAAVCGECSGTGCSIFTYKVWAGKRKGRRGIRTVMLPWGRGQGVAYAEFQRGKRPKA